MSAYPEILQILQPSMKLLSVEQVAETLGISRQTVSHMIAEKSLPAIKVRSGKRKTIWRIRPEVLERWLIAKEKENAHPTRQHRKIARG